MQWHSLRSSQNGRRPVSVCDVKGQEKRSFHCMNGNTKAGTVTFPHTLLNTSVVHASLVSGIFLTFLLKFSKPGVPTRSVTCKLASFWSLCDSRIFAGPLYQAGRQAKGLFNSSITCTMCILPRKNHYTSDKHICLGFTIALMVSDITCFTYCDYLHMFFFFLLWLDYMNTKGRSNN